MKRRCKTTSWPLAISILFVCFQTGLTDKHILKNVSSLCSQCQCLDFNPFRADCSDMDFKEMPEFRRDLVVPWILTVDGNALVDVPVFPILDNLTAITLRYNKITKIEESAFANLRNLTALDLSHNNLTEESLNSEVFSGLYQEDVPDPLPLRELKLNNNQISALPKNVFKHLTNLTTLNIGYNPFRDFSQRTAQALSQLQSLKTLDISYAQLTRLPRHFFAELVNLMELDLSGNFFISVPPEVNYARTLRTLSINDNEFGIITGEAFWDSLEHLQTLHLQKSRTLHRIDNRAFGNLSSLQTLWLSDNPKLRDILPFAFVNSRNQTIPLKELHLENNRLEYLPEYALDWKNLSYLNLQENPWKCDCNFEVIGKEVLPAIAKSKYDLTLHVLCASPAQFMGMRVTEDRVQKVPFVCVEYSYTSGQYGFVVVATIVVGTLLLVTGTIIFSYVLFKRTKMRDWIGENVKYRRTLNDDEEIITSNSQY